MRNAQVRHQLLGKKFLFLFVIRGVFIFLVISSSYIDELTHNCILEERLKEHAIQALNAVIKMEWRKEIAQVGKKCFNC